MRVQDFLQSKIPIVEIFSSISGEGISAGYYVTFVRSAGCNLRCSYCDTNYSYDEESKDNQYLTPDEIVSRLSDLGCKEVICTGGEPLELNKPKRYLPMYLASKGFDVRIETNGSCPLYSDDEEAEFFEANQRPQIYYALDVKSPGSGMSHKNIFEENFIRLKAGDELKFIVGDKQDIDYALDVIDKYKDMFSKQCVIINFSPVFGKIDPKDIVEMISKNNKYFSENDLRVRFSLQIHKFIWPPEARGV